VEALAGALNEQLSPSALRPPLPAAKAALEALMQQISSAAAAISMINLMAGPSLKTARYRGLTVVYIIKVPWRPGGESARYLHKNHAVLRHRNPSRVLIDVQGAYHSV
jgi:hypothetical protein